MKDVKEMRKRAIAFIKSLGGQAGRREIKEYLGLDPIVYWPTFDRAMKTKSLVPIFGDGVIGTHPDGAPLVLSRKPVVAYRIA